MVRNHTTPDRWMDASHTHGSGQGQGESRHRPVPDRPVLPPRVCKAQELAAFSDISEACARPADCMQRPAKYRQQRRSKVPTATSFESGAVQGHTGTVRPSMESPAFWLHDPLVAVGLDPPMLFPAAPSISTNVREVGTPATLTRRQEAAETSNTNRPCHEPRTDALATSSSSQTSCTRNESEGRYQYSARRRREGCDRGRPRTHGRQIDHPCRAHTPRTKPDPICTRSSRGSTVPSSRFVAPVGSGPPCVLVVSTTTRRRVLLAYTLCTSTRPVMSSFSGCAGRERAPGCSVLPPSSRLSRVCLLA
jgi:hypothetical protein